MNAIRSNNVSLKYQRFTSSGCKDIGFTKTEFVAKTQFLYCRRLKYRDMDRRMHMEEMTRSMVAPFLDLDGLNKLKEQVNMV